MPTNPIGKGTKNVTVNVPDDMQKKLKDLAQKSGLSLSAYIRAILEDAAKSEAGVSTQVIRQDRNPDGKD